MSHRAVDFAMIRYLTNEVENLAISAYGGDPRRLDEIKSIYRSVLGALHELTTSTPSSLCPWEICADGSCRPRCPETIPPQPTPTKST